MKDIYTIATKRDLFHQLLEQDIPMFLPTYQARPEMELPILIRENNSSKLVMAKWGLLTNTATNFVNMNRVLKQTPYNRMIRSNRCSIPANCFVTQTHNKTWLVRLLKQRLFWMGGLYEKIVSRNGQVAYRFAILKTDPADVLASICKTMPVMMNTNNCQQWITPKNLASVMAMADQSGRLWFDYFQISDQILDPNKNEKELLIPLGSTYQQYQQRKKQFKNINVDELRANSRGRK